VTARRACPRNGQAGNLDFYRALVNAGGGRLSGEHMLAGFIMIQPDNEIGRQLQLLAN
jgi:hypothetical protein